MIESATTDGLSELRGGERRGPRGPGKLGRARWFREPHGGSASPPLGRYCEQSNDFNGKDMSDAHVPRPFASDGTVGMARFGLLEGRPGQRERLVIRSKKPVNFERGSAEYGSSSLACVMDT
jgi:hypothetical protein